MQNNNTTSSKINLSSQSQSEQQSSHQNLSQLRKDVQLSPTKLRQITNTNEYIQRVVELNNNAKQSIDINRIGEALIYLSEAERILEHAANYGRVIEKGLIVHVLHNAACCYQKGYELGKCSGYLEALIYNYNTAMRAGSDSEGSSQNSSNALLMGNNNNEVRKSRQLTSIENIEKRNQLARYYLQFQVVNSQQQNHSGALIAGRKAIQILKSNFKQIYILSRRLKKSPYEKKFDIELKTKIIDNISRLNDNFSINNNDAKFVMNCALFTIKVWLQNVANKDKQHRNYVLQEQFKHYSIGNPLNLTSLLFQQSRQQREKNFSAKNILQKLLTLGICYFTIATQLRYISTEKYQEQHHSESVRRNSTEFRQSQLYHLLAIIIISYFVPFEILLMKHITSSFQTHYKTNLIQVANRSVLGSKNELHNYGSQKQSQKYESFLFPQHNRVNQSASSIIISAIGDVSGSDNERVQGNYFSNSDNVNNVSCSNNNNEGTVKTVKKKHQLSSSQNNQQSLLCGRGSNNRQDMTIRTIKNNNISSTKIHMSPNTHKIPSSPNSNKKLTFHMNNNKKSKSKSRSKQPLIMNNLAGLVPKSFHQQSTHMIERSPVMKSPRMHLLSPSGGNKQLKDSRGIVKIKTTQRVKISTEKIQYRKDDRIQRPTKDSRKSPVVNVDYFTSKSKDMRKSTQGNMKVSQVMQSPRAHNTSKSSSRRQSPVPNYFQPMNIKSGRKTIKSPRMTQQDNPYAIVKPKEKKKTKKMTFQQYYL